MPGLAERMEVSADGRDYIVTLRPEAVWEDGRPVTSRGRRLHDPEDRRSRRSRRPSSSPSSRTSRRSRRSTRGASASASASPTPSAPMAFVLPAASRAPVRGAELPEGEGQPGARSPTVRTGWSSWKAQESVELERNPTYPGAPRPLRPHRLSHRAGQHDGLPRLPRGRASTRTSSTRRSRHRAAADPAFAACCRLVEFYNLDYNYIALNNRSPFFADARVRRALTMLLDRAAIVRSLYRGLGADHLGAVGAGLAGLRSGPSPPLPFDPAAAKPRLLDEAGWRDTDGRRHARPRGTADVRLRAARLGGLGDRAARSTRCSPRSSRGSA